LIKKLHFLAEYTIHYLKKYFLVIILGIAAGSLVSVERNNLVGFYLSLQTQNSYIGIEGLYTTQSLPTSVTDLISYGFTVNNEKNEPVLSPLIANLEIQNDNHSYLFTFKDNLFWHNGQKFSAYDIILDIPGAQTVPKSANQLEIRVKDPYSPLLSLLTRPIFYKKTLIGLGPYQVGNITYQDGYVKTLTLASAGNLRQKIIYHFYSNNQDLVNAFKLGEVNQITTETLDSQLGKWPNTKITPEIATDRYVAVFLNTVKFENKQLRQALAYATPKTTEKNDRCLSPISPNSWAYNENVKQYNFDPAHAKQLYTAGQITTNLNLTVIDRRLLDLAENIKNSWQQIFGISVTVNADNSQIDPNNYDAILAYGQIPADPDQYYFWHSTQLSTNVTHLNNSRIDKLLEEGRQTFDQPARKQIYYDFQKFLLEESPAIFIKFPTTYNVSRLK
jgi:peptide/nickel transport system substrate-binding protein